MFRENRKRLLERLAARGCAAVVPTNPIRERNADTEFAFRPGSDFYWLTGFGEPECVLVLRPGAESESVLFLRARDAERETWTGRRLGVEAAPEALEVDEARDVEDLWDDLPELLAGYGAVLAPLGHTEEWDRRLAALRVAFRPHARRGKDVPREWLEPAAILHELRLVKSEPELERMRRAAAITREAHVAAMAVARPGRNERDVQAVLQSTFLGGGASGSAYPDIVAGGANACILHYVENRAELRAGELLLVDAGAELECYASDVTRTFPIDGRFTAEQRALYEVVLTAQASALEAVRPGGTWLEAHEAAVRRIVEGLVELGLLEGPVDGAIESKRYRRFYMHTTGHWLGLDVHDCGAYWQNGAPRPFEPGMVTTVEPGVYVAPDDETVDERWRGIGIRIEDDVLVTEEGREILSEGAPKEIDEVEAACRELAPASAG